MLMKMGLAAGMVCLLALPLRGDDGAASVSAGGLVAVREQRVTMAKEVLLISLKKIVVDYDFRNDTDGPVTTEIAFPIPRYTNDSDGADLNQAGFDDFKLFVGGKPMPFQTEAKAVVKGRDVSALLHSDGVDVATFGHLDAAHTQTSLDFKHLTPAQMQELMAAGAVQKNDGVTDARWAVEKRYHWTQTFPAHGTVHIRHEYTPVSGSQILPGRLLTPGVKSSKDDQYGVEILKSMCLSPAQARVIQAAGKTEIGTEWVDFILTTANSWKRPIEDFTLIVERTDPGESVSFCWNGPVTKLDANHFQAHATNLVPAKELHIGYYQLARGR